MMSLTFDCLYQYMPYTMIMYVLLIVHVEAIVGFVYVYGKINHEFYRMDYRPLTRRTIK